MKTPLFCAIVLLAGCKKSEAEAQPGKRPPMLFAVETASAQTRRVEYLVTAVGTIEPFEVVQITARVAGALDSVKFREGDLVSEGALLAQIDSERYHLAVESARAAVSKAEAAKLDAEEGLTRRDELNKTSEGLVRGEELATFRTKVKTAEADLAAAEANLQLAQLNDRGANVRAPFSGIAQTRAVVTGQQVQPGTVLTTLVRRDPLMLKFAVPEQEAARLRPGIKATLKVRSTELQHTATLTHVSEVAENVGRTVAISAKIDPGASGLRAGGFAEVTIPVQAKENAVVIPATAIRPSERGFLAFVIEKNAEQNIARERILLLGLRTAEGDVEVISGIKAGESVVVRGAEALREGAGVKLAKAEQPASREARASP